MALVRQMVILTIEHRWSGGRRSWRCSLWKMRWWFLDWAVKFFANFFPDFPEKDTEGW